MRALAVIAALASCSLPAWANFAEPPTITVIEAYRLAGTGANTESANYEDEKTSEGTGPFVSSSGTSATGDHGNELQAIAVHSTTISSFSIRGRGLAHAVVDGVAGPEIEVGAQAISSLGITFTIPVAAPYTLSGVLGAQGNYLNNCLATATVTLLAIAADNTYLFGRNHLVDCNSDPGDSGFFFAGNVPAGATLNLTIVANAFPHVHPSLTGLGTGDALFDFVLDFGDRDGDGLLDEWEENGIDFGDIKIDLPGMGADPDHKDIFVEVDVMSGVPFDPAVVNLLEAAFATAPANQVRNPDGQPGINLHIIHDDGDVIPYQALAGIQSEVFGQLAAIKQNYFGSEAERSDPAADAIRQARALIFRYALWADTLVVEDLVLSVDVALTGLAEFIGNDFIVAAGWVDDTYSLSDVPDIKLRALAGNFMHELGHTLGLRHGGQDDTPYKPHYLSVMNYTYSFPYDVVTVEGTNMLDIFELDYSRSSMGPIGFEGLFQGELVLDETSLTEDRNIGGPIGRKMRFNSAHQTDPVPVNHTIALAYAGSVDWNNDGLISAGTLESSIDLTRYSDATPVAFQDDLRAYTDWDRLWYHLSGAPNFEDPAVAGEITYSTGMPLSDIAAFLSLPAFDQTAPDPSELIFSDGFESGSAD